MSFMTAVTVIADEVKTLIDVSGVDFSVVSKEIVGLVPAVLPGIMGILSVRKGINFLMGSIRGA